MYLEKPHTLTPEEMKLEAKDSERERERIKELLTQSSWLT